MTPEERQSIQERMAAALEETRQEIVHLEKLTEPVAPDCAIGRLSRMEAINSRSVNEAQLNQARLRRSQLEAMLASVDKADFGLCAVCRNPIPVERLIWMPESNRCVRCA